MATDRCCNGRREWCVTCGGTRWGSVRNAAHWFGRYLAERLYERQRHPRLMPPAPPLSIEDCERSWTTLEPDRPRLRRWLATVQLESARERWTELAMTRSGRDPRKVDGDRRH